MIHIHLFRQGIKNATVSIVETVEEFLLDYDAKEAFILKEGIQSDYIKAIAYPVINGEPDFNKGSYVALNAITGRVFS